MSRGAGVLRGQIFHQGLPCIWKSTHVQGSYVVLLAKCVFLENIWLTNPLLQVTMYNGSDTYGAGTLHSLYISPKGLLFNRFVYLLRWVSSFRQCEYSSVSPTLHTERLHKARAIFGALGKIIWTSQKN